MKSIGAFDDEGVELSPWANYNTSKNLVADAAPRGFNYRSGERSRLEEKGSTRSRALKFWASCAPVPATVFEWQLNARGARSLGARRANLRYLSSVRDRVRNRIQALPGGSDSFVGQDPNSVAAVPRWRESGYQDGHAPRGRIVNVLPRSGVPTTTRLCTR